MTARAACGLVLAGALAGCIPPGAPPPARDSATASPANDPLIAPRYEDVLDEPALWEARPVVANAVQADEGSHSVSAGETLGGIALAKGTTTADLARENGLEPPYTLRIGQVLRIPAGRWHRVAEGETGIAIARAYGLNWSGLVALNALEEPFILKVGQRLKLPPPAAAAPVPPSAAPAPTVDPLEARAAAFKLDIEDILTGGEPAQATGAVASPSPASPRPVTEPTRFTSGFGWPAAGSVVSRFGPAGEGQINQGIEIRTIPSAPVAASGDGVVAFVGDGVAGYGGMIMIRHGTGWISVYGRVASATVRRGDTVKRGDVIGATGSGSAPQLHFQLRKARVPVDPLKQLPPR